MDEEMYGRYHILQWGNDPIIVVADKFNEDSQNRILTLTRNEKVIGKFTSYDAWWCKVLQKS